MTMVPPATTKGSYFEIAGLRSGASAKHSSQRFVERNHHLHCLRPTGELSAFLWVLAMNGTCWTRRGRAKHDPYFFWLPKNVTTCPRSAATKR